MAHHCNNLDRSLDDMIRSRPSNSSGSFRNHQPFSSSSASGPYRTPFLDRVRHRAAPYSASQVRTRVWPGPAGGGGTEAKLYISNLDPGVTSGDLEILFSELGELKYHSIHYDREGRSLGAAEVVYVRRVDAEAALNRYNDVKLDGKPMKIEFIGVNVVTSDLLPPVAIGEVPDNSRSIWGMEGDGARACSGGRGPNHDGWGMRRNQSRQKKQARTITAEELDADLDEYKMSTATGS